MVNITEIGITAGEIWQYLDKNSSGTLEELHSNLNRGKTLILLSLGWLAREGHIILENEDTNFCAKLTQKAAAEL